MVGSSAAVQTANLPPDKKVFRYRPNTSQTNSARYVYMLVTDATARSDSDFLVASQDVDVINYNDSPGLVGRIISPLLTNNRYLQSEQLVWVQLDSNNTEDIDSTPGYSINCA